MTFYDDAEFAAIRIARLAAAEFDDGRPRSSDMHAVLTEILQRHGNDGVAALVAALGRQYASALTVVASHRSQSVEQVLDGFERHKLEQTTDEDDL